MVGGKGAEGPAVRGGGPDVAPGARAFARRGIALALIAAWAWIGVPPVWSYWIEAVRTPIADGRPAGPLHELLSSAAGECPAEPRLLLLSDEPIAWMQGSYVIYPRRIDVIQSADGFTSADLDTHSGGCLVWYRSQAARVHLFNQRLTPVRCLDEGCLYRIQ